MHVRRGPQMVEVFAPAKLNLFLEVLGKRADGFHEIETVMTRVSLYDTLTLADDPGGAFSLENDLSADSLPPAGHAAAAERTLPTGSANIVVRALEALREAAGVEHGARVRLVKRIPMAAGMAGGSTDAAAALVAANIAWRLDWSRTRLAEIAATLGSDIPYFFTPGPALCRGRGEQVEPLSGCGVLHFAVIAPPEGLSTAAVYRACRPSEKPRRAVELIQAWQSGNCDEVGRLFHNRLQDAAEGISPWINRLARELHQLDCLGHRMSGSGTSYFALCRSATHARSMAATLRGRGLGRTMALMTTPN
ncbi:MAG: 4-(cytidine 5'-diphospho)-2-C-methyl-D-erythritol kinase [Pirellula sp.]|nr:4-(cytidine 5'-diphospho)-2-C-methyl-D-erythritol kinase [Pirellula sp.]